MPRAWEWRRFWTVRGSLTITCTIPLALRDPGELFRLRNRIARERFDAVVYLSTPGSTAAKVIRDSLFFLGCGIRRQYGIPVTRRGRSNCASRWDALYQSESDRLVSNLQQLGRVDLRDDRWWDLGLSADEHAQARGYLSGTIDDSRFFALSIGTKAQVNDWTQPNWLALVRALDDRYSDRGLVTFGSADEHDRSAESLEELERPEAQSLWEALTSRECGYPGKGRPVSRSRQWPDASRGECRHSLRGGVFRTSSSRSLVSAREQVTR